MLYAAVVCALAFSGAKRPALLRTPPVVHAPVRAHGPRAAPTAAAADKAITVPEEPTIKRFLKTGVRNISDGEPGKRGEVYVGIQLAALFIVIFGDLPFMPVLALVNVLLGPVAASLGGAAALMAAIKLGSSLSPWPTPVTGNELKTTGAYAIVRHPMYVGLSLLALGCATMAQSVPRLIVSVVLAVFLRAQALFEEARLKALHKAAWDAYAAATPRFVPTAVSRLNWSRVTDFINRDPTK